MRVSVFLPDCKYLSPPDEGSRHGAFLATTKFLQWVANEPEFAGLEVFLPPPALCDPDILRLAAETTLRPENRGRGQLSFYLIHHLPEVWKDGAPRILRSIDPHYMARDRYLRDAFAQGPMPLSVDTHTMGSQQTQAPMALAAGAERVPYDSLQCLSPSMRDAFERTFQSLGFPGPPFRMDVIGRPVDCENFRPATDEEKAQARDRYQIPLDATVAIFHSRVGPYSKADLYPLVQAFAQVAGPNDWLIISGTPTSGTAYEKVAGWLDAAGVSNRTRLLGSCPHEEVPTRLWAADFFVLPCDNATEGIGIATVEALACGLPALVSDWDGMRAAVRDGENGFLTPTYWIPGAKRIEAFNPFTTHLSESLLAAQCIVVDQDVMTERLRQLFVDPALRARLAVAARQAGLGFDKPAIEGKLLAMFREQMREAEAEPEEVRERRRAKAKSLGLPLSYDEVLANQGTRALREEDSLELTPAGQKLLTGEMIPIYEEVALLAGAASIGPVLKMLAQGPQKFGDFSAGEMGDSAYAVGVLMKRGAIRIRREVG